MAELVGMPKQLCDRSRLATPEGLGVEPVPASGQVQSFLRELQSSFDVKLINRFN